jgi:arginine repressor
MPYRRLPNTDLARLRALKIAFEKGKELPPFNLAFSQSTFQKVLSNLYAFEKIVQESRQAYSMQVEKSKDYTRLLKKVKLYMSHFIQVINMAITRGDMSLADRDFFGFGHDQSKVPSFGSEAEVIKWGEKLIQGETLRIKKGLTPVTNPSMAIVKVRYENFTEAYKFQKILQKNLQRSQEKLIEQRLLIDTIISLVWNEVEEHYKNLPDEARRNNAKLYGVVYFYRKNELSHAI